MRPKRPRIDWERIEAIERDLGFTLPPSVMPEREVERRKRAQVWQKRRATAGKNVLAGLRLCFIALVALGLIFGLIFGLYEGGSAIMAEGPPPKLPAHVRVGPNETFLVTRGYGALGDLLCESGGKPEITRSPEGEIVACQESEAIHFSYPKSDRWNP